MMTKMTSNSKKSVNICESAWSWQAYAAVGKNETGGWDVIIGHCIASGRPNEDKQQSRAEKSLSSDAEDDNPTKLC